MKKIAIYGGSFDPIHNGHKQIIEWLANEDFDEVWIAICQQTSYRKHLSNTMHRYNMVKIVTDYITSKRIDATWHGVYLKKNKIGICVDPFGKTYELVKSFKDKDTEVHFVVGSDSLQHISKWFRFSQLKEICNFLIFPRNDDSLFCHKVIKKLNINAMVVPLQLPNTSSSEIREYIIKNRCCLPPWEERCVSWLDDDVIRYIRKHGLYLPEIIVYDRRKK